MFKRKHMRGRKKRSSDKNEQSEEDAETDEDDDSDAETCTGSRFSFARMVPDEVPMRKKNILELKKKNADAIAAETEYERIIVNWIDHKVKWRKLCTKRIKLGENDKIDMKKQLWGIDMTILLDHSIQESGEERQFGSLPEMFSNSPYQLDVLTSESFSERMISTANLLVDTHHLHLNDGMIDKLIVLRMNKRFMERVRSKKVFSSVMFDKILSNESEKV